MDEVKYFPICGAQGLTTIPIGYTALLNPENDRVFNDQCATFTHTMLLTSKKKVRIRVGIQSHRTNPRYYVSRMLASLIGPDELPVASVGLQTVPRGLPGLEASATNGDSWLRSVIRQYKTDGVPKDIDICLKALGGFVHSLKALGLLLENEYSMPAWAGVLSHRLISWDLLLKRSIENPANPIDEDRVALLLGTKRGYRVPQAYTRFISNGMKPNPHEHFEDLSETFFCPDVREVETLGSPQDVGTPGLRSGDSSDRYIHWILELANGGPNMIDHMAIIPDDMYHPSSMNIELTLLFDGGGFLELALECLGSVDDPPALLLWEWASDGFVGLHLAFTAPAVRTPGLCALADRILQTYDGGTPQPVCDVTRTFWSYGTRP